MRQTYVIVADDRPWFAAFIGFELTEVAAALLALPEPDAYSVAGHHDGAARPLDAPEEEQLDYLVATKLTRIPTPPSVTGTKWAHGGASSL